MKLMNKENDKEVCKIMSIISDHVEKDQFSVNEFKEIPDHMGVFQRHGKWFVYTTDEHAFCSIHGPFNRHGIVCAVLKKLHVKNPDYQWKTEEERSIYINNHFRSLAEVDVYMDMQ